MSATLSTQPMPSVTPGVPEVPSLPLARPPVQHTRGGAGDADPDRRRYRVGLLALLAIQGALCAWVVSNSFFFNDDLLYGGVLGATPLSPDLLLRSWFGHLVPGFIAADWAFYQLVGLDWTAAGIVMVSVTLGTTVAMVRLLESFCGRTFRTLVLGACFALSLVVLTQVAWWGAVMTNVVPLGASIAALGSFVRWDGTGRVRHLVSMTVCFGTAVSFYEKSVLTAAYIGLLSVLVIDAGLPWRQRLVTAVRRWPAWLLLGGVAGLDVGYYLTHDYLAEAGPAPDTGDLAAFLYHSLTEGLVPASLGFHLPTVALFDNRSLTVLLANGLLLFVVVTTSWRSRQALGAWVFFASTFALNQGVLGRGRVSMLGVHMGTILRYQLENSFLLVIAMAVALPYLRGAWPRALTPRLGGRRLSAWGVLVVGCLVLTPSWVTSLRAEIAASPGSAARSYFAAVVRTDPVGRVESGQEFVAGHVPAGVVYPWWGSYRDVLPQVLYDVRFTRTDDHGLGIDATGTVRPVAFAPTIDLGGAGTCVDPGAVIALRPPSPLPDALWFVQVRYTTGADSAVRIVLEDSATGSSTRMVADDYVLAGGAGQITVAPGMVPLAQVGVQVTGTSAVCLAGVQLGSMESTG